MKKSTAVNNFIDLKHRNLKQSSLLPLLFVALLLASGCGSKSGNSNAAHGDVNVTVVASDGKTPLQGYEVIPGWNANQDQYLQLDTQNSSLTTDQNGNAHMRIDFLNPSQLSSAPMQVAALPPGCHLFGCGVGIGNFSLQVGQTVSVTVVTNVT